MSENRKQVLWGTKSSIKRSTVFFLLAYLGVLIYATLLTRSPASEPVFRADLFWSYDEWLHGNRTQGRQILSNIALFIPLAYYLSALFSGRRRWWVFPLCVLISALVEGIQYVGALGQCDCDDLINNAFGTLLGMGLDRVIRGNGPWRAGVSCLLLLAGLLGCFYISQRDRIFRVEGNVFFTIDEIAAEGNEIRFGGICGVYGHAAPDYDIDLAAEDGSTHTAQLRVHDTHYSAVVQADPAERYEVILRFHGKEAYHTRQTMYNGVLEPLSLNVPPPELSGMNMEAVVQAAELKVYEPSYEVYVYQQGNQILWLVGGPLDERTGFIFHLFTDETELLPEARKQYGFDNLGFRPGGKNELTDDLDCGRYRVFAAELPTGYPVRLVTVGFHMAGDVLWTAQFRPGPTE